MSLRQVPKRKQTGHVVRRGAYPNVVWEHYLECGHVEKRKRKAVGSQIACQTCGRLQDEEKQGVRSVPDLERFRLDEEHRIAATFDVPPERVTVIVESRNGQAQVVDARVDVTGLY